jgi:hypothetical protein
MGNGTEDARERFRREVQEELERSHQEFTGIYGEEIRALLGLSRSEIDEITPDATDLEAYDRLITVVKAASRTNQAQAELKTRITELGDVAVRIAKRVPELAALF